MEIVTLRLTEQDRREWTAAANREGRSLSNWIRRACRIEAERKPATQLPNGVKLADLVIETGAREEIRADTERTKEEVERGVRERREAKRNRGTVRKIEDVTHAAVRKLEKCPGLPKPGTKCAGCGKVHEDPERMLPSPKDEK